MKSKILNKGRRDAPFPKMMTSTLPDRIVVLFPDESGKNGMILKSDENSYQIGQYCDWNLKYFEDFEGELIISNNEIKNEDN